MTVNAPQAVYFNGFFNDTRESNFKEKHVSEVQRYEIAKISTNPFIYNFLK